MIPDAGPRPTSLPSRVKIDHMFDRATADFTEQFAAREHDAIDLGPVVTFGFVHRAFEGAYFAGVFFAREELHFPLSILAKQSFHLGFGAILCTNPEAPLAILAGVHFVFFL